MKKLIINADDFGQTPGITKGILECFKNGVVRSTTVITNYPDFDDTLQIIKKNPKLSYGFHLNLVDGKALSGVSSLTDENGNFFSLGKLFIRLSLFMIKKSDLEKEINMQLSKLTGNGVKVTHADGHRHTHIFPFVINSYLKILKKHNVNKIRLPEEKLFLNIEGEKLNPTYVTKLLVSICSKYSKIIIRKNKFKTNSYFLGMSILSSKDHKEMFMDLIKKVPDNHITEILVHPGYGSKKLQEICPQYNKERENEIRTLTNPEVKKEISKNHIKLINYLELTN